MPSDAPTLSPDDDLDCLAIAKLFGVSEKTVQRWDREGLLPEPSFVVGATRTWKRKLIDAWRELGGTKYGLRLYRRMQRREKRDKEPQKVTETGAQRRKARHSGTSGHTESNDS